MFSLNFICKRIIKAGDNVINAGVQYSRRAANP